METLSNSVLTVQIAEHGAELQSIKKDGKEYLWQGDAKFWGRRSPVLFPIVGRVWNNKYRHAGNTYEIGQHGFARDMNFNLTYKEDKGAVYWLESTPDTLGKFPFPFRLLVGYLLEENKITVKWRVENLGAMDMYFQIGAHPAFDFPKFNTITVYLYLKITPSAKFNITLTGENSLISCAVKSSEFFMNKEVFICLVRIAHILIGNTYAAYTNLTFNTYRTYSIVIA